MTEQCTRILLVDDDEDDYFITKDLLSDIEGWQLELDWARDYNSALAVLARESHDVYLLDYRLGSHDGLALMREVFSHGRCAPVILLTGQDDPEVDVQAMKGGAADFLVKGQLTASLLERSIRYAIERCRVEERLRQREQQLHLTLVNAPLGIFTSDLDGRFHNVNPAFESIVGFTADQLRRMTLPELLRNGGIAECEDVMRRLIDDEMAIGRLDRQFARADGRRIQGIVTVSLMRDPAGRPQQMVGQLEDVTERRDLERLLTQSEKLKSIGQLAAGVAHEINTPTQFVGYNLQFLSDAFATLLEPLAALRGGEGVPADADFDYLMEEIPRALEQSIAGIRRVSTIARSVSELAHPNSRTREPVDLNRAVEATVLFTKNRWKSVAEVETDLDLDLPPVTCLPGAINQVLLNLMVNAIEAIADDRSEKGEIRISTAHTEGWVEIRIADNGAGVPEQIRPRIFDPFFTTKETAQSTGQGLAIAHNVVVGQHGGRILVVSREGRGSVFTVRLPLIARVKEPPVEEAAPEEAPPRAACARG